MAVPVIWRTDAMCQAFSKVNGGFCGMRFCDTKSPMCFNLKQSDDADASNRTTKDHVLGPKNPGIPWCFGDKPGRGRLAWTLRRMARELRHNQAWSELSWSDLQLFRGPSPLNRCRIVPQIRFRMEALQPNASIHFVGLSATCCKRSQRAGSPSIRWRTRL